MAWAAERGIAPERLVIDPGIGLGKSPPQDLELMRRLDEVAAAGRPVLVPISNKKVLGAITGPRRPTASPRRPRRSPGAGRVGRRCSGYTTWGSPRAALQVAEALVTGRPERWHDVEK